MSKLVVVTRGDFKPGKCDKHAANRILFGEGEVLMGGGQLQSSSHQ